jgi:hypothetical protein
MLAVVLNLVCFNRAGFIESSHRTKALTHFRVLGVIIEGLQSM